MHQLLLAHAKYELLSDEVATHVALDGRGVLDAVSFDHVDKIILVSSSTPCFLQTIGSPAT